MLATLADVARKAGCSNATVSRVINNMGQVSSETRESVLRAMKSLNYVPRPSAPIAAPDSESKSNGLIEVVYFADASYEQVTLDRDGLKIGPLSQHAVENRFSSENRLSNSFYRAIMDWIICE